MRTETTMGGPNESFPTTDWPDLRCAAAPGGGERLEALLRAYWRPVYAYIRATGRVRIEDAKDLAQGFFGDLLARGSLARAREDRGSFRGFLKKALRNFLIDAHRAERARVGHREVFQLDASAAGPDRAGESPDRAYDREWFHAVLQSAVDGLRDALEREGRGETFAVFRTYCLEPEGLTYAETGRRFGMTPTDVRHALEHCRQRLRDLLRERIREYVSSEADVERELQEVLRG